MKFWESGDIIHLVIDMKIINRKYYIDKLIALKNKPDIKIITGVRRAGKSVLLNEFSGIKIIDLSSWLLDKNIN